MENPKSKTPKPTGYPAIAQKRMPKALKRKLDEIKRVKKIKGHCYEEIIFDAKAPPKEGYTFLPQGDPGLTGSCRRRARNAKLTVFTVYDTRTCTVTGVYVPAEIRTAALKAQENLLSRKHRAEGKPRGTGPVNMKTATNSKAVNKFIDIEASVNEDKGEESANEETIEREDDAESDDTGEEARLVAPN